MIQRKLNVTKLLKQYDLVQKSIFNVSDTFGSDAEVGCPPTVELSCSGTNSQNSDKQVQPRRKHCCLYCNIQVGNFSRHSERHHSDEFQVQEFMSLDKRCIKRRTLIAKPKREGDFCPAKMVPVLNKKNNQSEEFLACIYCRGYYCPKIPRRHVKKCSFNYNPKVSCNAQSKGQTLTAGPFGPHDVLRTIGLLDFKRADRVTLVAKKDIIICEVGRRYIRSHKERHLLVVAKRLMRRLARLLLAAEDIEGNSKLELSDIG